MGTAGDSRGQQGTAAGDSGNQGKAEGGKGQLAVNTLRFYVFRRLH
jgi:hypothetical protein